jgi:hypothetical protein
MAAMGGVASPMVAAVATTMVAAPVVAAHLASLALVGPWYSIAYLTARKRVEKLSGKSCRTWTVAKRVDQPVKGCVTSKAPGGGWVHGILEFGARNGSRCYSAVAQH